MIYPVGAVFSRERISHLDISSRLKTAPTEEKNKIADK